MFNFLLPKGYIAATEAYLKIRYDAQRNKIMRQTLLLSISTFSMGCGTAVASVFGMNLTSHFENHPHMFYYVVSGVSGCSFLIFVALFSTFRNRIKK